MGCGTVEFSGSKALGTLRVLLANEFFTRDEISDLESIFNLKLESLESFAALFGGLISYGN